MITEKEEQYLLLIDNPVLGIAWGTLDGKLTSANKTFFQLIEGSIDELKGKHLRELVHPDDFEKMIVQFQRLAKGEIDSYQSEHRFITRKKNTIWVKVNVSLSKKNTADLTSVLAIVQDISERKKAEQMLRKSEAFTRGVLSSVSSHIAVVDETGKIIEVNKAWNDFGLANGATELSRAGKGSNYYEACSKAAVAGSTIAAEALAGMQEVMSEKRATFYLEYSCHSPEEQRWFAMNVSKFKHDAPMIVVEHQNITDRRIAQEYVVRLNNELEKKVKERTIELEIANKELEAFTYSVSHDLMAPLRIIDGFSQVLLDDYRNKIDEDGLQTIQVIKRNATRMGELVNDLLNLARLGRTNLEKRNLDMTSLVTGVIDEMRFTTNKLAAKIKLNELKPASCDHTLIKQVWSNLLSNAVKYSKNEKNPLIEIGFIEQNNQVVYYIKDNGVGFDKQYAGKLFGVFQRLHKVSDFPGTGVGLAIVHRIINRHGGKVWADAKVDEGAVFYFTLP